MIDDVLERRFSSSIILPLSLALKLAKKFLFKPLKKGRRTQKWLKRSVGGGLRAVFISSGLVKNFLRFGEKFPQKQVDF